MAMKPVTGEGAPVYTSGVHEWNGTAPSLNNSPTASSTMPASSSVVLPVPAVMASAISYRWNPPE